MCRLCLKSSCFHSQQGALLAFVIRAVSGICVFGCARLRDATRAAVALGLRCSEDGSGLGDLLSLDDWLGTLRVVSCTFLEESVEFDVVLSTLFMSDPV